MALPSIIIFNNKKEQVALITFLGVTTILIHIGSAENMAAFTVIEVSQTWNYQYFWQLHNIYKMDIQLHVWRDMEVHKFVNMQK